jgi:hypothetical protein
MRMFLSFTMVELKKIRNTPSKCYTSRILQTVGIYFSMPARNWTSKLVNPSRLDQDWCLSRRVVVVRDPSLAFSLFRSTGCATTMLYERIIRVYSVSLCHLAPN